MSDEFARRVVLSYPDQLGEWSRDQLTTERFAGYLRRVHDDVAVGEILEEFVDVGCCGASPDIPLRVEAVDGANRLGPETVIEFVAREGEAKSGWEVQSRAGPPNQS